MVPTSVQNPTFWGWSWGATNRSGVGAQFGHSEISRFVRTKPNLWYRQKSGKPNRSFTFKVPARPVEREKSVDRLGEFRSVLTRVRRLPRLSARTELRRRM